MKKILFFLLSVQLVVLASCDTKGSGDPGVENKLDGTWSAEYSDTEYEDGIAITGKVKETLTLDASDHTFTTTVTMWVTKPIKTKMFTVEAQGTWYADKSSLTFKYDKDKNDITFHSGLMDAEDKREAEKELMSDFESKEVQEIREINEDGFTVYDGETEIEYVRK